MKKYIVLSFVLAFSLILSACPKRVSIGDISADPSRYRDKEVSIAGTVTDSYGVSIPGTGIGGGAYEVDDGTGKIWIVTKDAVPARGAKVGVRGKVGSAMNWNGRNFGLGMYENERRYPRR